MILEEEKIFNYLNGFSSEKEKLQVEEWVSLSDSNKKEFEKLKRIYELSALDVESYSPDVDIAWSAVSDELFSDQTIQLKTKEEKPRSFQLGVFYRIAAVLVLTIGIAYFLVNKGAEESFDMAYKTKPGELKELVLADGTKISLNENTTFKYSEQFGEGNRKVYLEGEAFFNVAKDKDRPFVIESPAAFTRVLGTSFNLRTNSKKSRVDVYSGKVEFGSLSGDSNQVVITKGQSAAFKNGSTSIIKTINANANSWKTGQLIFEGAPMTKVVAALKKVYKVEINLDKNISNCTITSTFENDSLKEILEVIETIAQIKNTKKNDVIYMSGPGC